MMLVVLVSMVAHSLANATSIKGSSPRDTGNSERTLPDIRKLKLNTDEIRWLKQHKEITVAVQHGWMPIEFMSEGHQFRGISMDYLEKMESMLGVHFKKVSAANNPANERADMISALSRVESLENTKYVALDKPYLVIPLTIYTKSDNSSIHQLKDLRNKRVAVFKTGAATRQLSEHYPEIELYKVDIAEEGLAALESRKVDAYVGNQLVVNYNASLQGFRDIKDAGVTPFIVTANMAVRTDLPILKSILEKSLTAIHPEKEQILDKWNLREDDQDEFLLLYLLALSFLLAALFWVRSRRLKAAMHNQKKVAEERLWRKKNFDLLTDLPNRQMFANCLLKAMTKSERTRLPLAVLHLDLDKFKEVNEQLGHTAGDLLLIQAADRIRHCVRAVDVTSRLGGDEFAIILGDLKELKVIDRVTHDILEALSLPFQLHEKQIYTSVSIGITIYPNDSLDADTLLSNAEQAMYEAKRSGRNHYQYFTAAMQEAALKKHKTIEDMRKAIVEKQFKLFYQPIVNLDSLTTHKAEALIRWTHPERGLVSPAEFIPLAEETGMISEIGDWAFRQASLDSSLIRESLVPDFQISVNVSPLQFRNGGMVVTWLDFLQTNNLCPAGVCFEITEGILLDADDHKAKDLLTTFRKEGAQISIDDFGTGYSSLSYLKKLDIDYVKIDQSFVRNLSADSEDMALCEAIIVMSHKLGFKVIAEGIETKEQMLLLKNAGCDFGQGYYFARPALLENLEDFLHKSSGFVRKLTTS